MPLYGHDSYPVVNPLRRPGPAEGTVVNNHYKLLRRIGSGGLGRVYLAENIGHRGRVAIKFLRSAFAPLPGFVRRFEREAEAIRRLDHPNCVRLFEYGVSDGIPYLVMEFVDGMTLADLKSQHTISIDRAVRLTLQVLAGLRHAHSRSVVHRDLKTANIMVVPAAPSPSALIAKDRSSLPHAAERVQGGCNPARMPFEGSCPASNSCPGSKLWVRSTSGAAASDSARAELVRILDFGTAEILSEGVPKGPTTGTDVGTPWYMAPEQITGEPADRRADLYAMGVILFELLTSERPYVAEDPLRVLKMHLSAPIPSARALRSNLGLSPEIEGVIVRSMQKRPGDRFMDAEAFIHALEQTPEAQGAVQQSASAKTPQTLSAIDLDTALPTPAPKNIGHKEHTSCHDKRGKLVVRTIVFVASAAALGVTALHWLLAG